MAVKAGDMAPNFTLVDTEKKEHSLSEFSGKNVVLAFYPGAFTGVCTKEMCNLRDSLSNFEKMNAAVLGISVDTPFANKAFAAANHLTFPLLSDYTRQVSEQYCGLIQNFAGLKGLTASNRSVFVIDGAGKVRYAWVSESPGVEPPDDEVSNAVASIG